MREHPLTFEGVHRAHARRVRSQAARLLRHRPGDVDDVVQRVWVKVWRAWPSFRGDSAVSSWVYRIVLNEVVSYLRSLKPDAAEPLELLVVDRPAGDLNPLDQLLVRERLAAVKRRLLQARRVDRLALLQLARGETCAAIARASGVPVPTVKTRIHRARQRAASC